MHFNADSYIHILGDPRIGILIRPQAPNISDEMSRTDTPHTHTHAHRISIESIIINVVAAARNNRV